MQLITLGYELKELDGKNRYYEVSVIALDSDDGKNYLNRIYGNSIRFMKWIKSEECHSMTDTLIEELVSINFERFEQLKQNQDTFIKKPVCDKHLETNIIETINKKHPIQSITTGYKTFLGRR